MGPTMTSLMAAAAPFLFAASIVSLQQKANAFTISSTRFGVRTFPRTRSFSIPSNTVPATTTVLHLSADRDTDVERLMKDKDLTREQAENEYELFQENPGEYTVEKGEKYYKSLGYSDVMDGMVREAEKEGKGEEIRAELEEFKKRSSMKAISIIGVAFAAFVYFKLQYFADPIV